MTVALVEMRVKPGIPWAKRIGKAATFCICYTILATGCTALVLHVSDALGMLEHMYRIPFWQRPYVSAAVASSLVMGILFGKAIFGASGISNFWLAIAAGLTNSILFSLLVVPDYAIFGPIIALEYFWLFIPLCLLCHFSMRFVARRWLYRRSSNASIGAGGSNA